MKSFQLARRTTATLTAIGLLIGPAAASTLPRKSAVEPLTAIGLLSSASSQPALCSAATAAAAGTAAAQVGQSGCVLPVSEAPLAASASSTPQTYLAPAAAASSSAIGVVPFLLGLVSAIGGMALLLDGGKDTSARLPVSPD